MATKETVRGNRARIQRTREDRRALLMGAELGCAFLLGAILSSAQIFGRCSPFGVAAVAAAGPGLFGFFTLAGAVGGHLFFQGIPGSLHYGAAAVLVYAVRFALYDSQWGRKTWFAPSLAVLVCGVTSYLAYAQKGWFGEDVIFYVTELLILGFAAAWYAGAMGLRGESLVAPESLSAAQRLGVLALGGTVLIALCQVDFMGEFSLGHMVAAVVVMLTARRGLSHGLLGGVTAGLLMDLASGRSPYYSMAYAVAGLAAGMGWRRGKVTAALSYLVANGAAVLWTWESGMRLGLLYEGFGAAVIFLLLPRRLWAANETTLVVRQAEKVPQWDRAREVAVRHLQATAQSFRELYEGIRESFLPQGPQGEDVAVVFHRVAERQCRHCSLRDTCWHQDYQNTQRALNDATFSMVERGRVQGEDFPAHFGSRCIHFSAFLGAVNEEYTAYLCRRQFQNRMRESREALCRQYALIDTILDRTAAELAAELTPDLPREEKLHRYLQGKKLPPDGLVYYDERGRVRVETPPCQALEGEEGAKVLSGILGITLREEEGEKGGRLLFTQAEPFRATASVTGRGKAGERVSGDTGTWFRREDGLLCILLCDGMGSGPEARQESSLAVRLLQSFLKAGVEPETALGTVNEALALKGQETGGCTTVDLLTIELYTGLCSVYKFGAAPSYLRKGGSVSVIRGSALPAGILSGEKAKPDITRFRGQDGDWVILLSDGITGGEEDAWLRNALLDYGGESPGELADKLLCLSQEKEKAPDDSILIAVRLERRS